MRQNNLGILLSFGLLAGPAAWCGTHPETLKTIAEAATRPEVDVFVSSIAEGQHWAVALQPTDGLTGFTVNPGYVVPVDVTPGQSYEGEGNVQRLPESDYTLSDSKIQLQSLSSANESVYVEAQVTPGKVVSVYKDGALVFHAAVTAPVLLIDGKIGPATAHPLLKAISLLMLPPAIDDLLSPSLKKSSEGTEEASTALLHQHLLTMPSIATDLEGQTLDLAEGNVAVVLVRIHVDKAGNVTSTHILRGQDPLASAAAKAVAQSKFKPFFNKGEAVEVEGVIQYSLSGKTLTASLN